MTATEADEDTLGADRTTVWSMGVSLLPKLRNAPERHQNLIRAATEILVRNLDVDVDRLATAAAAVRARGRERGAAGLTDLAPIPVPAADSDDSDGDAAAGGGSRLRIVATPAEPDRWEDQLALIRATGATYEANERCWYLSLTPAQIAAGALDPLFKAAADHRTRVSTDRADNAASPPPSA